MAGTPPSPSEPVDSAAVGAPSGEGASAAVQGAAPSPTAAPPAVEPGAAPGPETISPPKDPFAGYAADGTPPPEGVETAPIPTLAPGPQPPPVRPPAHRYVPSSSDRHGPPRPRFVSGYGGFVLRFGGLSGRVGSFTGVRGGILLGRRLSIGAAYYGLRRRYNGTILDEYDNPMALDLDYGGGTIGLSAAVWSRGELELKTLIGGGTACIGYVYGGRGRLPGGCVERVSFFAIEPGATLYFNVANWVRLGLEGGYRFATRYEWSEPNHFRLSGAYFGMNFEFGWFKKK